MTEENNQTESSNSSSTRSSPLVQPETHPSTPPEALLPAKIRDIKKEKCRAMTKVVIRRLPPSMNESQFVEQVSPLAEHDYLYFVKADMSLGQYAFSRAYINFIDQRDIFIFKEKFDNYVFVDSKGTEYPAVVEFAPFQRLPKKRLAKKKDLKCGTIETDPYYISFLESLENVQADSGVAQPKTEYSYQPADNSLKKVTTTPLLEYLKQRKQEKQRLKDEKREERRRRDLERRRAKDEPTISKVLKNPEMEKESSRDNIKEEKDKQPGGKEPVKGRNKREERKIGARERDGKQAFNRDTKNQKRHEEKRSHGNKDREGVTITNEPKESKEKKLEEKRGKSYEKMRLEKKRLAENKKAGGGGDATGKGNSNKIKKVESVVESSSRDEAISRESLEIDLSLNLRDEIIADEELADKIKSRNSGKSSIELVDDCCSSTNKKIVFRRSSLESGGGGGGTDAGTGARLRRHKSLDGGQQDNLGKNDNNYKAKNKKDPRLERRIRNKDRPAMEIYRPGMGRLSKQRIEREKSINDDRGSLSQSPTPP